MYRAALSETRRDKASAVPLQAERTAKDKESLLINGWREEKEGITCGQKRKSRLQGCHCSLILEETVVVESNHTHKQSVKGKGTHLAKTPWERKLASPRHHEPKKGDTIAGKLIQLSQNAIRSNLAIFHRGITVHRYGTIL